VNRYALAAVMMIAAGPALAADQSGQAPCPAGSTVTSSNSSVTVGGKQAARAGDTTGCGSTVVEGSSNVFMLWIIKLLGNLPKGQPVS
jgi:uncharacterized Zn-binding protein involved in type VI secretion